MSYHDEHVSPQLSVVESSFAQVGAGVIVGANDGADVDGAGVAVGAGDGTGVTDGAWDIDGTSVIVGANVLPRKPPHAQHWRLAMKSSSSSSPQADGENSYVEQSVP